MAATALAVTIQTPDQPRPHPSTAHAAVTATVRVAAHHRCADGRRPRHHTLKATAKLAPIDQYSATPLRGSTDTSAMLNVAGVMTIPSRSWRRREGHASDADAGAAEGRWMASGSVGPASVRAASAAACVRSPTSGEAPTPSLPASASSLAPARRRESPRRDRRDRPPICDPPDPSAEFASVIHRPTRGRW